jgi:hypothetical protein
LLLCACYHGTPRKNRLAYIGSTLITQQDIEGFAGITRFYPNPPEEHFLATRPPVGAVVETHAIYRKMRWNPATMKYRHSLEWKWRERYYLATMFTETFLQWNLGFTDNEIKRYFNSHRMEFANTVVRDSAGKQCTTRVVQPFNSDIKRMVAEKMFCVVHPPDSAFKKTVHTIDTNITNREWMRHIRDEGAREIFTKAYFKEKYGKPFPDSLKNIYGKGRIVSPEDMDVMISWVPAYRRAQIKNSPQGLKNFAEWLIRWKLFSEKAVKNGFASQPSVRNGLKWAWEYEIAQRYVNETLAPLAKKDIRIDTAMALYSYWDESETPGSIDSTAWKNHLSKLVRQEEGVKFDSLLYDIRRSEGVRFLQDNWRDDKVKDPVRVLRQADSLRDTGNTNDAEITYRLLVDNFFFTKEGKEALVELAKIKTEQQMYREAINNYRRFLVIDANLSKRYDHMFMIGFIYDEYLNKQEMAEVNYKWVLKNGPDCKLATDAEFMMQHLGEPMPSVDELQTEVKRQGKKVEAAETDSAGLKVEMISAKQKKK